MQYFADIFQMSTERECEVTVLPLSNVMPLKHVCLFGFFSLSCCEHIPRWWTVKASSSSSSGFDSGAFTYLPALLRGRCSMSRSLFFRDGNGCLPAPPDQLTPGDLSMTKKNKGVSEIPPRGRVKNFSIRSEAVFFIIAVFLNEVCCLSAISARVHWNFCLLFR